MFLLLQAGFVQAGLGIRGLNGEVDDGIAGRKM